MKRLRNPIITVPPLIAAVNKRHGLHIRCDEIKDQLKTFKTVFSEVSTSGASINMETVFATIDRIDIAMKNVNNDLNYIWNGIRYGNKKNSTVYFNHLNEFQGIKIHLQLTKKSFQKLLLVGCNGESCCSKNDFDVDIYASPF